MTKTPHGKNMIPATNIAINYIANITGTYTRYDIEKKKKASLRIGWHRREGFFVKFNSGTKMWSSPNAIRDIIASGKWKKEVIYD